MSAKTKAQLLVEIKALQKRLVELQAVEAGSHQKNDINKKHAHTLGERIKELNCLYDISSLIETPGISLPEILQGIANFLPPAFQYPQITCARITLNNQEYKTENFRETQWKLASEIKVEGEQVGSVEVFYLEQQPKDYEGPFLKEETTLIVKIAKCLGGITERNRSQEKLVKSNRLYAVLSHVNNAIARERDKQKPPGSG
jgi:hypothetical protein